MILFCGAGAGAAITAARHMMKEAKNSQKRFKEKHDQLMAVHRSRVRMGVEDEPLESRVGHDCYYMCSECGFLNEKGEGNCPGCNSESWYDLADETIFRTLIEDDVRGRSKVSKPITFLSAIIGLISGIGVTAATVFFIGEFWSFLLGTMVGVTIFTYLKFPLSVYSLKKKNLKRPLRWKSPSIKTNGKPVSFEKHTVTSDQVQIAPFSLRECIACNVGILFDAPGDAKPPEWALYESVSSKLTIDNKEYLPNEIIIEGEPEFLFTSSDITLTNEQKELMRSRGLDVNEGVYFFYESIVKNETQLQIKQWKSPKTAHLILP